jgi:peptide/nickel transport system permease protein
MTRRLGIALVAIALVGAATAPFTAPHAPDMRFARLLNAPPTMPRVVAADGSWHAPFIYRWRLVNQLEQRYEEDRSTPAPLAWFAGGHLVTSTDDAAAPLLLLGADSYGRDVFTRLLFGARTSLSLALAAALGALLIGATLGGIAGFAGGAVDEVLMRAVDFVMVLPAIYVVLALRGALPLVLSMRQVFVALAAVLALIGWPSVARGVRGILTVENRAEYAEAARALGASPARVIWRHLLPATRGFLAVQATILVPAFVMAEATLSFAGFGFTAPAPSWGAMLQDAAHVGIAADAPWLLTPAAALTVTVFVIHATAQSTARAEWLSDLLSRYKSVI